MGESLCSKSQSSLNRREAEHHNNGLMSKHTACLMNKLFEPHYLFSHWSFCIETSAHWTIIAPWPSSQSKWSAWRHCCCTPVSWGHGGCGGLTTSLCQDPLVSSAFYTTQKHLTIQKLRHLHIASHLIHFINHFLSDRLQAVQVGTTTSPVIITNTWIPQDSMLSPSIAITAPSLTT